jgi:hypothetical protein
VVVTAIVSDELAAAILGLRDAGRRMGLVSTAEDPPPYLEGVTTYHLPSTAPVFQYIDEEEPGDVAATLATAGRIVHEEPQAVCVEVYDV